LYSRLRFLTSACLIAFGTVVVAGAIGVLPALIERLSVVEVSPSCTGEIQLPWGRTCSSQRDTTSVAARNPGRDVQVADHPDLDQVVTVEPPQSSQNTGSAATEFMQPRAAVAPVQQLASAPPGTEEATQATPTAQAPTVAPSAQAAPIAPLVKPKPRSVKKVARREPSSERRRDEALSTVRRFGGNNVREIPVDAYAADGAPRRVIIIRPTSIQDVYYYYGRR
jgi:hypothetical protein